MPVGGQPELLVPKLKKLRLSVSFAPKDDILLAMIQSRWNSIEGDNISQDVQSIPSVTRLESVHLTFHHKNDCEQFARARGWRDEGLDIQITIGDERWL